MGFTAKLWSVALLVAMKDNRVLVEVRMVKQGNETRPDGFERPRWCDRPPYTLQCLYQPWTHCTEPMNATVIRPGGRPLKVNRWPYTRTSAQASAAAPARTILARRQVECDVKRGASSSPSLAGLEQADCVMRDAGLTPNNSQRAYSPFGRETEGGRKLGVVLPSLDVYDTLSRAGC